jgi:hypothetical protein
VDLAQRLLDAVASGAPLKSVALALAGAIMDASESGATPEAADTPAAPRGHHLVRIK